MTMHVTRRRLLVLGLVICCAAAGVLLGATFAGASGGSSSPVAAFTSASVPTATDQNFIQSLADDVGNVAPGVPANHDGTPLTGEARDLLTNAGPAHDVLGAFPTSNGEVCYEVLGAGACGRVGAGDPFGAGITFGILSTRSGGTRLYGVASDKVTKIDVEIGGADYPAMLNNGGFYYALPNGVSSDEIQNVIVTWADGSVHNFPVHG